MHWNFNEFSFSDNKLLIFNSEKSDIKTKIWFIPDISMLIYIYIYERVIFFIFQYYPHFYIILMNEIFNQEFISFKEEIIISRIKYLEWYTVLQKLYQPFVKIHIFRAIIIVENQRSTRLIELYFFLNFSLLCMLLISLIEAFMEKDRARKWTGVWKHLSRNELNSSSPRNTRSPLSSIALTPFLFVE